MDAAVVSAPPEPRSSAPGWPPAVNHVSESTAAVQHTGLHASFNELAEAQRRLGVRVGVNQRWRDAVLHVHTVGPYGYWQLAGHRGLRVVTAHTTGGTLVGSLRWGRALKPGFERILRDMYRRVDLVIAPSGRAADELRALGLDRPVEVVAHGMDPTPFARTPGSRAAARAALGLDPDAPTVVTVGHVQPRKGIDVVLAAARRLPEVRFVWVGAAPDALAADRESVRELMRAAPPNVTFTGVLDRTGVRRQLQAADIFLLASRHETFGMAPLEAGFSRLPLVLSDLPVFAEVFGSPGVTHLAAGDVDGFVAHLAALVGDTGLRAGLADAAEQDALRRHAALPLASHIMDLYASTPRR